MARADKPRSSMAARVLRQLGASVTTFLRSATRLATGRAASDAVSEAALAALVPGPPAPLKAMRTAAFLLPLAAIFLVAISLIDQSLFSFSRSDRVLLAIISLLGTGLGMIVYQQPRLSIAAFISLWGLRARALLVYAGLLFIPASIFDSVFLSRLFLGIIILPVVAAMWMMYREFNESNRLARAFPLTIVVMAAVPGFILPPYYQGIAGWTNGIEVGETITLYGYQFVNDSDDRIWMTHTLFTPVTQVGRFNMAWNDKEEKIGPIGPFILKAYERAYPLLSEGYMPHQRHLGRLAYPPSTYATNLPDHTEFPPERITRIQYVGHTYDRANRLVDTRVYSDYEVPRP